MTDSKSSGSGGPPPPPGAGALSISPGNREVPIPGPGNHHHYHYANPVSRGYPPPDPGIAMAVSLASQSASSAKAMQEQHASFLSEMAERYSAQERRQKFMTQAAASMSSDVSITRALAEKIVKERTKDIPVNTVRAGDFNMFVNKYYQDHGPRIAEMNLNHEKLRKQLMRFFERRQKPPEIADDNNSRTPWV
jgi:hypothetical protein